MYFAYKYKYEQNSNIETLDPIEYVNPDTLDTSDMLELTTTRFTILRKCNSEDTWFEVCISNLSDIIKEINILVQFGLITLNEKCEYELTPIGDKAIGYAEMFGGETDVVCTLGVRTIKDMVTANSNTLMFKDRVFNLR